MSYLTFKHVDFKTDDKLVLNDINFAIDEGDFVSIVDHLEVVRVLF